LRIDNGGTPTYFTERHGKGISVIQGRSKVMLSKAEAQALSHALSDYLSPDGREKDGLGDG
jgi:hypothetical protein